MTDQQVVKFINKKINKSQSPISQILQCDAKLLTQQVQKYLWNNIIYKYSKELIENKKQSMYLFNRHSFITLRILKIFEDKINLITQIKYFFEKYKDFEYHDSLQVAYNIASIHNKFNNSK